jgi:single-stranded DNA-binding protein
MSTRAIVSGALHKGAEFRTSKNNRSYATFTIRESHANAARWWQAITFNESTLGAIGELVAGEPLAVTGEIDVEIYAPAGGETRLNWKIVVDAVLSTRTKPKAKNRANTNAASTPTGTGAALDDNLPF